MEWADEKVHPGGLVSFETGSDGGLADEMLGI